MEERREARAPRHRRAGRLEPACVRLLLAVIGGATAMPAGRHSSASKRQADELTEPGRGEPSSSSRAVDQLDIKLRRVDLTIPHDCLPHEYLLDHRTLSASSLREMRKAVSCRNGSVSRERLHELRAALDHVQGAYGCLNASHMTVTLHDAGWGATIHGVVKPLMHAVAKGMLMHTPKTLGWTRPSCESRSLACIVHEFAPACEHENPAWGANAASFGDPHYAANAIWAANEVVEAVGRGRRHHHFQVVPVHNRSTLEAMTRNGNYPNANIMLGHDYSYLVHGDKIIPEEYRPLGWAWYASHLLHWAFKPDRTLRKHHADAMSQSGLRAALAKELVLGLHVRQGDSCALGEEGRTGRICNGLKDYMVEVDQLKKETGVTTIYLATDSEKVRNETKQYGGYRWLFWDGSNDNDRRLFRKHGTNNWDEIMRINMDANRTDENEEAARLASVDSMLLAECDLFVGKFSSNFFRFAYELKSASCNCVVPYASLDAPWCNDYAAPAGRSIVKRPDGSNATFMC